MGLNSVTKTCCISAIYVKPNREVVKIDCYYIYLYPFPIRLLAFLPRPARGTAGRWSRCGLGLTTTGVVAFYVVVFHRATPLALRLIEA